MASRHKIVVIMVMLYGASIAIDAVACMTTFVNDSPCKIAIFNKNDKTFMFIPKNGKRRFGSQHKHAYFALYTQQTKTQVFTREYVCKQRDCGNNGNVLLKFSDIKDTTDATELFVITKNKPHSSMVHTLPMIQKQPCHSCHGM